MRTSAQATSLRGILAPALVLVLTNTSCCGPICEFFGKTQAGFSFPASDPITSRSERLLNTRVGVDGPCDRDKKNLWAWPKQ